MFLVNKSKAEAKQVDIGKYGGIQWVDWSEDERYAVLVEKLEESLWFVAVDLEASESGLSEELPQNFDLNSFEWIDDKLFQAKIVSAILPLVNLEEMLKKFSTNINSLLVAIARYSQI